MIRIGSLGDGQLVRMMILDSTQLGVVFHVLGPSPDGPAGQCAHCHVAGNFRQPGPVHQLAKRVDLITTEIDDVDHETLLQLQTAGIPIYPSPRSIGIVRDKLEQKRVLEAAGIPVAPFAEVSNRLDIIEAGKQFGWPLVLKERTGGYDGRGNVVIENEADVDAAIASLKNPPLYVEKHVPFKEELAVTGARSTTGEVKLYPCVQTTHKNNICHTVVAPVYDEGKYEKRREANRVARAVMNTLHKDSAGVITTEMFYMDDGTVYVNEVALRVHNSAHFTRKACQTSQFEQHIRAITGLPLGSTDMLYRHAVMVNILGEGASHPANPRGIEEALKIKGVFVELYGKDETKHDRKMGHVIAVGDDPREVLTAANRARSLITI